MIKRFAFTAALLGALLLAALAAAQTTTATLLWNMPNTVVDSQGFTYTLKDGAAAAVPLTGVTCATVAAATQCQAKIPTPASGTHAYVLTASSTLGAASSAPLAGTTPGQPFTLTITITVTVP